MATSSNSIHYNDGRAPVDVPLPPPHKVTPPPSDELEVLYARQMMLRSIVQDHPPSLCVAAPDEVCTERRYVGDWRDISSRLAERVWIDMSTTQFSNFVYMNEYFDTIELELRSLAAEKQRLVEAVKTSPLEVADHTPNVGKHAERGALHV